MVNIDKIPNISIIVAVARNNAIGRDNRLLWHISDDLRRFKALTSGHAVLMGRNTWLSLPKRPLPGRHNIVLTHDDSFAADGATVVHSINQAFEAIGDEEETFVIGGASVYSQFMHFAQRLYVTAVNSDFDGDTFFPVVDGSVFTKVEDSGIMTDEKSGLEYSFILYERNLYR